MGTGKDRHERWVDWAVELQFIAQAGLAYSKDPFDIQRFQRIREISAEIISEQEGLDLEKVKDLFCNETGYQTPKLDCRASIFREGKILLVQERQDGNWALPGGWVDVNQSVGDNIIKEVREEAGLIVTTDKVVALLDRNKHNTPPFAYGVTKVFVQCHVVSGDFHRNLEIENCGYFGKEELPPLSITRNTKEQIFMCFDAYTQENWKTILD